VIPYAFHPEAEAEFDESALFYESRLAGLGTSFVDTVERTISLIRQYPEAGALVALSTRRVLVHGFPYAVSIALILKALSSSPSLISEGSRATGVHGGSRASQPERP
jgi:hypothetical protein